MESSRRLPRQIQRIEEMLTWENAVAEATRARQRATFIVFLIVQLIKLYYSANVCRHWLSVGRYKSRDPLRIDAFNFSFSMMATMKQSYPKGTHEQQNLGNSALINFY